MLEKKPKAPRPQAGHAARQSALERVEEARIEAIAAHLKAHPTSKVGRKPKALREEHDAVVTAEVAEECIQILLCLARLGDTKAAAYLVNRRYGRPIERIEKSGDGDRHLHLHGHIDAALLALQRDYARATDPAAPAPTLPAPASLAALAALAGPDHGGVGAQTDRQEPPVAEKRAAPRRRR